MLTTCTKNTEDTKDLFCCYAWANMYLDEIEDFCDDMLTELCKAKIEFPSAEITTAVFSEEDMLDTFIEDEEGSDHGQVYFDFSIFGKKDEVEKILLYLQERMDIGSLSGARFTCSDTDFATDYTQC